MGRRGHRRSMRAGHERSQDAVPAQAAPWGEIRRNASRTDSKPRKNAVSVGVKNISTPDLHPLYQEVTNSARGPGRGGRSLVRFATGVLLFDGRLPAPSSGKRPPAALVPAPFRAWREPAPGSGAHEGRTRPAESGGRRAVSRVCTCFAPGAARRRGAPVRWLPRDQPCEGTASTSPAGGGLLRGFACTSSVVTATPSCTGYRRAVLRAGMRPSPSRGPAPRGWRRNGGPCGMCPFRRTAEWPSSTPLRRRA